jgi:hypothetical protein
MIYQLIKPKFYLEILKELIHFIKYPKLIVTHQKSVKRKVIETIGLFIIKMTASISIALLLGLFYEPKNITDSTMAARFSPLVFLVVGGIILPSFEEIAFRLSLKYKTIYASLSLTAFAYYIVTKVIFKSNLSLVDDSFTIRILLALTIGILSYGILNRVNIKKRLTQFWVANFKFIYYASCIMFAWLHIFNFELTTINIILLPIITLPQLFSATIAGYTRVAFGFRYPLIIHMATNSIFISLTFLPFD